MDGSKSRLPEPRAGQKASDGVVPLDGIFRPEIQRRFIHVVAWVATLSLCVGYSYSSYRTEIDLVRQLTFLGGLASFVLSSVVVRLTQSAKSGAGILVIAGIGITLVPAYYDGGVSSPYAVWFLIVPLVGGLMLGSRIAYLAGSAGVVAILGLGVFAARLPAPAEGLVSTAMLTLNLVLAIVFSSAVGAIVSRLMTRSSRDLMNSRNAEIERNIALKESNERFKGSLDLATDAIVIINDSNTIEVFNPAAEAMYEIAAERAIGQNIQDLLIPARLRNAQESGFRRFRETGSPVVLGVKLETFSLRADGSEFPIELTVQQLSGGESQFIAYIRDLSERKRLLDELAQKEKQIGLKRRLEAIGRLSGGVAHDFNNLLMAINGYTEMLLLREDLPQEARAGLQEIAHAGDRASSITRQLLAFSRRDQLETERIQLTQMVSSLTDMFEKVLPASTELAYELDENLWLVESDAARLEQAVLNLILNAADAMPEGGKIILRSRNLQVDKASASAFKELDPGDYACLEVIDHGTGMDPETLEHIFDPFFTTKPLGEGTGLGLSTAYGIVSQSGGIIAVESTPGTGSTFRILLPRRSEVENNSPEPRERTGVAMGQDETILVVEDEVSVRNLVVRTLASQGYRVLEADNGEMGYELALRHSEEIDLVLTDVVMPKLGGAAMVRRLRVSIPDLRVIYVSGHSEDELDIMDIADPRTEFLYKPFNLEVLSSAVQRLLHLESPSSIGDPG
jgi:PAS domain S-box-containing protein